MRKGAIIYYRARDPESVPLRGSTQTTESSESGCASATDFLAGFNRPQFDQV